MAIQTQSYRLLSFLWAIFFVSRFEISTGDSKRLDITAAELEDVEAAAELVADRFLPGMTERIQELFSNTETAECRHLIATHLNKFVLAISREEGLPFADWNIKGSCPEPVYDWDNLPPDIEHIGKIQNRTYQPPRNETEYIEANEMKILYAILTHETSASTIRLIETLHDPGHSSFIVHVDGKEVSDQAYETLVRYSLDRPHVHILTKRVRVNWGGFTMVQAMLEMLHYAFNIKDHYSRQRDPLDFHKVVHLSSTSYPIASKQGIRRKLSEFPVDANFVQVVMKPMRPGPAVWNYFVECDDRVHRIHRLAPLTNQTHSVELFTSSQWFIISREFAWYIAEAKKGTFVHQFLQYTEHVVVADETFLGTVLRNTPFCTKHHNQNFLHLQFDRWESDLPSTRRDQRKCPMKDPNHCGRSPTLMTMDYADILELSDDLFARKFIEDDMVSLDGNLAPNVKDMIDGWVNVREELYQEALANDTDASHLTAGKWTGQPKMRFEGHGVLIVAKESLNTGNANDVPLCLGLGKTGNNLRLVECFHRVVVPTLAEKWYTGAVILEETLPHNRWDLSPCTSDGSMEWLPTGQIRTKKGKYSKYGPRCMLKMMDGLRAGRCFDGDSGTDQPGGEVQVFPCMHRWVQFLSVGDGELAPEGSLFFSIPEHIVAQIVNGGHAQIPQMCLGVWGRGVADEVEWDDPLYGEPDPPEPEEWPPLSDYVNEELFSTQCTNKGAVVEWLFVPFIVEEDDEASGHDQASGDPVPETETDGEL